PVGFKGIDVDRHSCPLQQLCEALELEAHHRAADVVGVVMGDQYTGQVHVVGLEDVDQISGGVGRVDDDGVAGLAVADEVGEVAHLRGDHVAGREVAPREQLPKVQAVGHVPRLCGGGLELHQAGGAALVQVHHIGARAQKV